MYQNEIKQFLLLTLYVGLINKMTVALVVQLGRWTDGRTDGGSPLSTHPSIQNLLSTCKGHVTQNRER